MGKDIPGGPDQGTLSGRALLAQALTQDPKAIALFAASGNPEDLHFESPSPRENMEMRRRNVNAYLKFLNEHEIGGSDLRAALKTHEKDVETVMRNGRHPEHAYHKAFFHFDAFNQKIFDHLRSNISGDSDVSIPEHFQCTPIWAKYSGDIAADKVEETAYALMEYLNKLSHILMISQVKTNGENIEEKLMAIETIVEFFKRLQPLTGIPWQSFRNLQNPDFFQDSDDSDVKNLAAINRPIPETAEFIGDESMMAYNLIKAAYAAMDFHEGDAFSKTDRQKARAYFQEHREEMGKRVYLWDNLLKEVFDRADVIFPDEGIIDIERAGVIRRSEDALAGGAVIEQQPGYEDHYYGEYFKGLPGDLFAWGDQEVLAENDAKTLRIYEAVKGQLAKSRQWLSEHQLDSPEILEVLKRYEEDWELSIRLLKAGVYTMPGTTACVLFCLSPELDKKVRKAVKAGNLIDIDKTSLESILALWGRLTIRPRGSMRATKFLKFYEELHALLFSAIQGISQMQNQNNLAGFAFLLNTLMFLFKIDKKGGTIKINRFKQIVKAAHNVHGRKFFPKARPMEVYINEDVLLYLIIDACNKLVTHEERDPYSENDREDTLAEVLELSRSEDAVPGERDETKAKDFELCIKFLQEQLPKIFALADEMFAGKRPQGSAVAMPAVAIPDGIGAPPDVADARPGVAAGVTPLDGDGYGEDKDKFRLPGGSAAPPEDDGDVRYDLPGGADAIVPPDHEIGPLEIATFEQLTDIVPIIFMSSKEQEKRRRGWQGEAALARANCEEKATVVAGDFEGTAHINHSFIKEVFIQRRNPEAIVFPSNLICTGTVELKTKGKSYLLNWKIDERGQLTFIIGDKTYNKETFSNGVAKLENLYLESQAIILRQLEILLVRQEHELKARRWGAVLSSEEIGKVKPVTIRGGTEIQPRFEKLVGSVSNGKGKAGPTVTVVGRIAMELLERIKEGQVILEEDANGIILYLRLDEEVEAGKRIEPLYMPCNTIQVLQAVDRGKRSMDEVFVMSSRHRVGRAGYHPHRDTENPRLLIATQRTPDEESEAVKEAVEAHFRVKLTTSVSNTTAITIPKGDEPIEAIVIGTREEIAANNADTILIREIEEWAKGKRDAISQTARDRIQEVIIETETGEKQEVTAEEITHLTQFKIFRVVFNAEQKPQFTIGSYESLADVQKKLVTEESAKVPAAAETASV